MARGKKPAATLKPLTTAAAKTPMKILPPEVLARRTQIAALRDPRTRALWSQLTPRQERLVHDPSKAVGHRYPLTSGDVAKLTTLTERQVRYWADKGLIPCWHKGSRRLFEAAGLIVAFAIENSNKHEMNFYRSLLEEPAETIGAKVGILSSLLAARLEGAKPAEAKAIKTPLHELMRD